MQNNTMYIDLKY